MASLFVYGTLRCPDIMKTVTGRLFLSEPAVLAGYRALVVKGEDYPGIIETPGVETDGIVYRELDEKAFTLLDAFEGEMYARRTVTVQYDDGREGEAFVYVVKTAYRAQLDVAVWDFDRFVAESKAHFKKVHLIED